MVYRLIEISTFAPQEFKTTNFNRFKMKKIYLILGLVAVTSAASAQRVVSPRTAERATESNNVATHQNDGGDRAIFYTNDFSDCSDFTIGNAANDGFSGFVDDLNFVCGTAEPSGPAAIDGIASTTASNGFMMVDSDEYGGESGGSGVENCYFQTADAIDCSAHPFVSLSFDTFYRMWDNGNSDGNEYCLVEVSRDGVTWPSQSTYEESQGMVDFGDGDGPVQARWELWPLMLTQDPVTNPTSFVFDITSAAGGQDQVWIRFRWKGTWGYAWMVDDMELFDTPDNDLAIQNYATYSDHVNTFEFEYGAYPVSQVRELQMAVRVKNNGVNGQTNVSLGATVNGADAGATSNIITVPYGGFDTLRAPGYTIPATVGNYDVQLIVNMDNEDENPGDNVADLSFEVTQNSFGRDDKTYTGQFPAASFTEGWMAANLFWASAPMTVYAIDVAFRAGSANAEIIAHVYDPETFDIIGSTEELGFNPDFINNGTNGQVVWYTLVLEEPLEIFGDEYVMCGIESFGGAGVRIGESKFAPEQTSFVYGNFGTAGIDWYFTNEVPMVRLNTNENAQNTPNGIKESTSNNFSLNQNVPNPANQTTRIDYSLKSASKVAFEVRDITGRLISSEDFGTQSAGNQNIVLNVANFASGVYNYSLIVNGERETMKMIIK